MYVTRIPNRDSRPAVLLRESYREGGKVKSRTIANLTKWPPERIAAMERLCKGEFDGWAGGEVTSGEIFGVLFALKHLADQVGITRVLGASAEGRLGPVPGPGAPRPRRVAAVGGALGGAARGGGRIGRGRV